MQSCVTLCFERSVLQSRVPIRSFERLVLNRSTIEQCGDTTRSRCKILICAVCQATANDLGWGLELAADSSVV